MKFKEWCDVLNEFTTHWNYSKKHFKKLNNEIWRFEHAGFDFDFVARDISKLPGINDNTYSIKWGKHNKSNKYQPLIDLPEDIKNMLRKESGIFNKVMSCLYDFLKTKKPHFVKMNANNDKLGRIYWEMINFYFDKKPFSNYYVDGDRLGKSGKFHFFFNRKDKYIEEEWQSIKGKWNEIQRFC